MRESIGGAWLYGLVIGFIILFTSFLTIAINYTKVFKVKNEVTSIIEKQEGFTTNTRKLPGGSLTLIGNYLKSSGYTNKGRCPGGANKNKWFGFIEESNRLNQANNGKYLFCVKKSISVKKIPSGKEKNSYYYDLVFFFKVDLPIIGELITFKIEDQTFNIYDAHDNIPKNLIDQS